LARKEMMLAGATTALIIYVLALSMLNPVMSAVNTSRKVSNSGSIKGVGVGIYNDQSCTSAVSSINWGVLEPGLSVDKTVYIRNEGNSPAILSMAASNWSPSSASSYMTLRWNYAGQTVNVDQVIQVKLTLSVSSSISGINDFSFDITITASG
jgi:hypothetical protein